MRVIKNERGIALITVLVLALISLAIISTLVYLVLQGTRFSGYHKRYATALEASFGGAEISKALIYNRGNLVILGPPKLIDFPKLCDCGFDSNPYDDDYPLPTPDTCLCRKLCMPPYKAIGTYNWNLPNCSTSFNLGTDPDFTFPLSGYGTNYQVSVKIVDTTLGNTDLSGSELGCGVGAAYQCGSIPVPPTPYLYRIEINTQDVNNVMERSRLSGLYAY